MGQTITIIGGDKRELFLADFLVKQGYKINLCGHDKYPELPAENFHCPIEAANGAKAIILPLSGLKENLEAKAPFSIHPPVINKEFFASLPQGLPVFVGFAREDVRQLAKEAEVILVEVGEDDELAILNSVPTAEGAVAIAMDNTPITIHGNNSMVIGFGRCAISLARMIKGIGGNVTIVARKSGDFARAHEMGFQFCSYEELSEKIKDMDFVFNSVPALVLPEEVLVNAKRCQIIVDIASSPGGTDFEAAAKLGIKTDLALGLPGKVAPITAGTILTQVYPRFLQQYGLGR